MCTQNDVGQSRCSLARHNLQFEAPVLQSRSSFTSSLLKLASGSVSAQILTVLSAPLIARLFLPAAFGTAALFTSITTVIGAVVTLRYEYSIMLPASDDDAANSMAVSLSLVLLTSILTMLAIIAAEGPFVRLIHAPELFTYMRIVPLGVALIGVNLTVVVWITRAKEFGWLTAAQIAGVALSVAMQIGAGLLGYTSAGVLIIASLLSVAVQAGILAGRLCLHSWPLLVASIRPRRMLHAFRRYRNFPKFSMASTVLNNVSVYLPHFFLSAFFSPSVVGYYALGNRLLRMPANLIGNNVATIFFQHAAEARRTNTLSVSVKLLLRYMIHLIVFPSLVLALVGEDVFVVILGREWAEAGVYTQILTFWLLFWFISTPLAMVLTVLEKQALELRLMLLVLISRLASLVIGGLTGSVHITLWLFSGSGVLVYGYYCLTVLRHCLVPRRYFMNTLFADVLKFLPAGIILVALNYLGVSAVIKVASAAILVLMYFSNIARTDPRLRSVLNNSIGQLGYWLRIKKGVPCPPLP